MDIVTIIIIILVGCILKVCLYYTVYYTIHCYFFTLKLSFCFEFFLMLDTSNYVAYV